VRTRTLLAAAVAAVAVAACGTAVADDAATVNGIAISGSTIEAIVAFQYADNEAGRPSPEQYEEAALLQMQVLTQLIEDEIKAQAAEGIGIVVTDEQIDEEWLVAAEQFGGEQALHDEIDRRGLTESEVRRQIAAFIREQMLSEYFFEGVEVDPGDIERTYEERRETEFEVVRASHILVETEEEAEAILDELAQGADFAELAGEHSIDEGSAIRGGELGDAARGQFVEPFDDAVWAAEEGEVVGPVETQFGWHVIRVEEFRVVPLAEVETQIRQELAGGAARQAYDAWYAQAVGEAEVDVAARYGRWDPESGQVVASDPLD
jgi:parvulin-like peptidyl-prolyl isomerase